jgi:D-aspartate ligase
MSWPLLKLSRPAIAIGDLNMLRCFDGSGVPLKVAIFEDDTPVRVSNCARDQVRLPSPFSEPEKFITALVELGRELPERGILFYSNDTILRVISDHRDTLKPFFDFTLPSREIIDELSDKSKFTNLARKLNLPVPETLYSHECSNAQTALEAIGLPCVFKPLSRPPDWYSSEIVRRHGGKPCKMFRADSATEFVEDFNEFLKLSDGFVMQRYIPGGDQEIYSFHGYFGEDGSSLAHFCGRKLRTYPRDSGVSTFIELTHNEELTRISLEMLKSLEFVGPVKIDFKRDPTTGKFWVLEINARYTLWNYLGSRCGVNLKYAAYADLTGQRAAPLTTYSTGVRWLSLEDDLRAFLQEYHPSGDLSWFAWLRSLWTKQIHAAFCWHDPLPFLEVVRQILGRQIRRRLI